MIPDYAAHLGIMQLEPDLNLFQRITAARIIADHDMIAMTTVEFAFLSNTPAACPWFRRLMVSQASRAHSRRLAACNLNLSPSMAYILPTCQPMTSVALGGRSIFEKHLFRSNTLQLWRLMSKKFDLDAKSTLTYPDKPRLQPRARAPVPG